MSTIVTRSGKGSPLTHVEVDANFTNLNTDKYQSGDAVSFTTLTATGQTSLGGVAGSDTVRVTSGTNTGKYTLLSSDSVSNTQLVGGVGGTGFVAYASGTNSIRFRTNGAAGNDQMLVSHTASAVNYVQVTGAATGGSVVVSGQGSDANVGVAVNSKGAGTLLFQTNGTTRASINSGATFSAGILASGVPAFVAAATASQVNYLQANGSATGGGLQFQAIGSDTNISQVFQSKGTGAIDLAAGSSGVNISNGGTVTALTRTSAGSGYTSFPTINISPPTTAGGVQATASITMTATSATLVAGGSGYTVNDVLTVVGGTFTAATQITVSAVSGGVITAVTVWPAGGSYSVLPTNPVSVTGGTGSGATFNLAYGITSAGLTVTNAGSGYVEQPTVSFSGGGGSGAAAYATVGSGTVIRSLGSTGTQSIDFYTPASNTNAVPAFRMRDVTTDSYLMTAGASLTAQGNSASSFGIWANGSGSVNVGTNGTSNTRQLAVAHTASAVNYVQVTGAATGAIPTISAQGSDASVSLNINGKGGASLFFSNNGGNTTSFRVNNTTSSVNYPQVTGGVTGSGAVYGVAGTDTNIDLTLTPKGTGAVVVSTSLKTPNTFGFKNRIINGAMMIDQRNAGAASANTINGYFLDRWQVLQGTTGKLIAQQNAGSLTGTNVPTGLPYYLGVTSQSAYSVGVADYYLISQYVEGLNTSDLAWGTANAQAITLSFWVRSSLTGTFGVSLCNSNSSTNYIATYVVNSANTWEQKSITIAGPTTGTWQINNSLGIQVRFCVGAGSNYFGTAGSWTGSNLLTTSAQTSVVGTNGATFYITGVQLEKGSTATSFDYRPYGTELALCQRYYEVIENAWAGATAVTIYGECNYAVVKRAIPTVTRIAAHPNTGAAGWSGIYPNTMACLMAAGSVTTAGGLYSFASEL